MSNVSQTTLTPPPQLSLAKKLGAAIFFKSPEGKKLINDTFKDAELTFIPKNEKPRGDAKVNIALFTKMGAPFFEKLMYPLMASRHSHAGLWKQILRYCDLNESFQGKKLPEWAAIFGKEKLVKDLLKKPEFSSLNKNNLLAKANAQNKLIQKYQNISEPEKQKKLYTYMRTGMFDQVAALLIVGVPLDKYFPTDMENISDSYPPGKAPLQVAVYSKYDPKIIDLFLLCNANPNLRSFVGDTPLSVVCTRHKMDPKDIENAEKLLNHGANPDTTYDENKNDYDNLLRSEKRPLLFKIARDGHFNLVKAFCKAGADTKKVQPYLSEIPDTEIRNYLDLSQWNRPVHQENQFRFSKSN